VTDMYRMFLNATSFNQPIGAWDTHNVTDMRDIFDGGCPIKESPPHWYLDE
jgi:surface protein